jgi:GNAT superfamily N-acetyltransferase
LLETLFSEAPAASVILAEIDGKNAGMATYHSHYSTFLARPGIWLDDLFVREPRRGRRIGEALMKRLSQICIETGAGRIEWSVAAQNALGIKFYERIGATVFEGSRVTRLDEEAIQRLAKVEFVQSDVNQG